MNFERPPTERGLYLEATYKLEAVFSETQNFHESGNRESAKESLKRVYSEILELNKTDSADWNIKWDWNSNGQLTKGEYEAFLLRRKQLDNAIGIMTASGVIRHDVCKDIL